MTATLLHELACKGVVVTLGDGGKLRAASDRGEPSAELMDRLKSHKADVVSYLECSAIDERIIQRLNALHANGKATFEELERIDERRGDAFGRRDLEALQVIEGELGVIASCIHDSESEWNARPALDASWAREFNQREPQPLEQPSGLSS